MTRYYLTFSGARYEDTTRRIVEDAPRFGADSVLVTDDYWLRTCRSGYWDRTRYFREHHQNRGVDWFCFKSFVILDIFRRLKDGDVLLFTDADTFPIADLSILYDTCIADGGVMLFGARGCLNGVWSKRDIFTIMGCDEDKYRYEWQTVARFMLYQKGGAFPVEKFLGEWLGFTCNPIVNTFDPSVLGLPDYPEFRESRAEQSVLSLLRMKYGLPIYREACQFGCWLEPPMLEHERDVVGHQSFEQYGAHSYRTGFKESGGDESEGSSWRNIND